MKKIFYLIACCLVGGLFWQCNDDDDNGAPVTGFKFPLDNYTAPQAAGKKLIEFTTIADWTATVTMNEQADLDWCKISPTKGGAGRHMMTIEFSENLPYDDRTAEVVVTSGGVSKTLKITQTNINGIEIEEASFSPGPEGGIIDVHFTANCPYEVIVPEEYSKWISLVPANKAMEPGTIQLKVSPNVGFAERMATVTLQEKGDINTDLAKDRVRIYQGFSDVENKIASGVAGMTAPSVMTSGNSMAAVYTTPAPAGSFDAYSETNRGPHDLKTGAIGLKVNVSAPFNQITLESCTWQKGPYTNSVKLYLWDTDYATTVAKAPLMDESYECHDNQWEKLIPEDKGYQFPGGVYLLVCTNDEIVQNGCWASDAAEGISEGFVKGEPSNKCMRAKFHYVADVQGRGVANFTASADAGKNWTPGGVMDMYSLNKLMFENNVMPSSDISLAKAGNYYYATFGYDNHVYAARAAKLGGDWTLWDGKGWSTGEPSVAVDTTNFATLAVKGNTVYAYYAKRNAIYVATAPLSDNWPSSLKEQGKAYTMGENSTVAYVRYHADIDQFVALYTIRTAALCAVSKDGITFEEGDLGVDPLRSGMFGVQYAVDDTGVVPDGDQYFVYGDASGIYVRPKMK